MFSNGRHVSEETRPTFLTLRETQGAKAIVEADIDDRRALVRLHEHQAHTNRENGTHSLNTVGHQVGGIELVGTAPNESSTIAEGTALGLDTVTG